jgi:hypothetical protein
MSSAWGISTQENSRVGNFKRVAQVHGGILHNDAITQEDKAIYLAHEYVTDPKNLTSFMPYTKVKGNIFVNALKLLRLGN